MAPAPPVAWIAGVGASGGLGAALARRFAAGGLLVAVTGRHAERVQALAAAIVAAGGQAHALPGDVSSERDTERLSQALESLGLLRSAGLLESILQLAKAADGEPEPDEESVSIEDMDVADLLRIARDRAGSEDLDLL